ncbi:MAG: universal stress protein [Hyphomicrobiales bacterium]
MFTRILLPIDLGEESSYLKPLAVAERLAADYDAALHVMTVIPTYSFPVVGSYFPKNFEKEAMDATKAGLKELLERVARHPERIKGHVAHGTIYAEIIRVAEVLDCDLIVLASHRPDLKDYLLGPNAARVVRHADRSVFVVRP